jgi:hypothetical protein
MCDNVVCSFQLKHNLIRQKYGVLIVPFIMSSVAFKGRRTTMQSDIATMRYDARQREAALDIVKRNIAMSFSSIVLKKGDI